MAGLNVFSLFDGMGCGYQALKESGIEVDNYFASETDRHAIKIAMKNHPDIIHVGDIKKLKGSDLPKIDLVMGGSPCQGFSFAGKRLNFEDPRSALFFEYVRLLEECRPKWFLLENVQMDARSRHEISKRLGVEPIMINSSLVSAQQRKRLYWTNIKSEKWGLFGWSRCAIPQPKDKKIYLCDILEENADFNYLSEKQVKSILKYKPAINPKKAYTITVKNNTKSYGGTRQVTLIFFRPHGYNEGKLCYSKKYPTLRHNSIFDVWINSGTWRMLTTTELERLQTLPDGYTLGVSVNQRHKMLGNGWTIAVINYIISYLKEEL